MKTLDRTPITREAPPHKRRRSGRAKPFKVERRWVAPRSVFGKWMDRYREWHYCEAYETERGRDNALRALQKDKERWEYRPSPAAPVADQSEDEPTEEELAELQKQPSIQIGETTWRGIGWPERGASK